MRHAIAVTENYLAVNQEDTLLEEIISQQLLGRRHLTTPQWPHSEAVSFASSMAILITLLPFCPLGCILHTVRSMENGSEAIL